jgi:hypothetical protein
MPVALTGSRLGLMAFEIRPSRMDGAGPQYLRQRQPLLGEGSGMDVPNAYDLGPALG